MGPGIPALLPQGWNFVWERLIMSIGENLKKRFPLEGRAGSSHHPGEWSLPYILTPAGDWRMGASEAHRSPTAKVMQMLRTKRSERPQRAMKWHVSGAEVRRWPVCPEKGGSGASCLRSPCFKNSKKHKAAKGCAGRSPHEKMCRGTRFV